MGEKREAGREKALDEKALMPRTMETIINHNSRVHQTWAHLQQRGVCIALEELKSIFTALRGQPESFETCTRTKVTSCS